MELGPEKLDVYCHSIGYVAWVYEKTRNSAACCEVLQWMDRNLYIKDVPKISKKSIRGKYSYLAVGIKA